MPGEEPGREVWRGLQGTPAAQRSRFRGGRSNEKRRMARTLLIRNAQLLVTMDAQRREIADGAVFVRGNVIEAVGASATPPVVSSNASLILGEVRLRFDLVDLFGVALAVRGDQPHPFVAVELLAGRAVHRMLPQIFCVLQKGDGLHAGGEGRGVELVLGVEDQRPVERAYVRGRRRPLVKQVQEMSRDRRIVGLDIDAPPARGEVVPVQQHRGERSQELVAELAGRGHGGGVGAGRERARRSYVFDGTLFLELDIVVVGCILYTAECR